MWAYSQTHQTRYWYNRDTKEASWINPHQLVVRKRSSDPTGDQEPPKRYRAGRALAAIEDHPSLSVERDKLLGEALDLLAAENEKYGEMAGETKTARSCRQSGMKVGMQGIFARIMWYELLNQILTAGDVGSAAVDSILPTAFEGDPAVLKEFVDGGRTEQEGRAIMHKVGRAMVSAAQRLLEMKRSQLSRPLGTKVTLTQHLKGTWSIDYEGAKHFISSVHLDKLLRLYRLHSDQHAHLQDPLFLRRVYCVLARYETLSGKSDGYQMAFPDAGFQFLRDRFGAVAECFASPLNCWNNHFCSIARDTDQFFGSLGNFFCFQGSAPGIDPALPIGGSFEANPPFVEAVMNTMAERIFYLLEKHPTAPFSFIVIVPAWADCAGVIQMTDSIFTRPHRGYRLVLEKKKHDYRPGMQHRTGHSHQQSNVDTFVFFLQNDAGAKRWPVCVADGEELRSMLEEDCRSGSKT